MATPSSPPPPASRAVKLAAAALVLLMGAGALGAMEWFMRRRSEQRWGFTDAVEQKTFDPDIGGVRMQPNLSTPRLSTNALGYRGPLPPMPKPAGRVRLAFLGASTTFCHEVGSEAATWPHQVWQAVAAAYPLRDVDYLNGAISGWSMPVMRKAFVKDVAALRPDIVFIYEAPMSVPSDIAIAQAATLRPITDVAADIGLGPDDLDLYGKYKAKVALELTTSARERASW
jgi:hypothetical protein